MGAECVWIVAVPLSVHVVTYVVNEVSELLEELDSVTGLTGEELDDPILADDADDE